MATPSPSDGPTIGDIARRLGKPIHRIEYLVRERGITAVRTVERYHVFDEAAIRQISAELRRIDQTKNGGDR